MEAAVDILISSFYNFLGANYNTAPYRTTWKPIRKNGKRSTKRAKSRRILTWMTCAAACGKKDTAHLTLSGLLPFDTLARFFFAAP